MFDEKVLNENFESENFFSSDSWDDFDDDYIVDRDFKTFYNCNCNWNCSIVR